MNIDSASLSGSIFIRPKGPGKVLDIEIVCDWCEQNFYTGPNIRAVGEDWIGPFVTHLLDKHPDKIGST